MATDSRERPRRALGPVSWPHHRCIGDEAEWLAETQWVWIHARARRGPGIREWGAGFGSEPGWGFKWRTGGRVWVGLEWGLGLLARLIHGRPGKQWEGASEQHVRPTSTPSSLLCPAPLLLFRKAYWGPKWGGISAPSTDL